MYRIRCTLEFNDGDVHDESQWQELQSVMHDTYAATRDEANEKFDEEVERLNHGKH